MSRRCPRDPLLGLIGKADHSMLDYQQFDKQVLELEIANNILWLHRAFRRTIMAVPLDGLKPGSMCAVLKDIHGSVLAP